MVWNSITLIRFCNCI